MNTPTAINHPHFTFRYLPERGGFELRRADGTTLHLACQAAVSQLGRPDAGLGWRFMEERRDGDGATVHWRFAAAATSCWAGKVLHLAITPREVLVRVEVQGKGAVERVAFFAGYDPAALPEPRSTFTHLKWARPDWRRQWVGSPLAIGTVFNPQPMAPDPEEMAGSFARRITCATTFGPERFNTFFAPPLYAYVFDGAFCAGVVSAIGASRYHHFDYTATAGWGLELDFDGKTRVDGSWTSPALRLAVCDSVDAGLTDYVAHLRAAGLAPAPATDIPSWAWRPMVCGWGQQTVWASQLSQGAAPSFGTPITPGAGGFASERAYEEIVRLLDERELPYGTLTIDMGWSRCLTIPRPNPELWTDLKGFIARQHARGKRVFLWLATWNPGGLDEALRMPHAKGLSDCCDPTNPEFRRQLTAAITDAISPAGLDADGFKIDFTGDMPRGDYQPAGDLWGLDLMHDYLRLIHDAMKAAKPEAVLETHCPNPQFADVTEMIRLNDLFCLQTDVRPAMAFRSRMARIAMPGLPIDCDGDPFLSSAAWLDYVRAQPSLGIPSIYSLTHVSFSTDSTPVEPIDAAAWLEVRDLWRAYLATLPA